MKRAVILAALALAACGQEAEQPKGEARNVLSSMGNMASCNDGQLETTWDRAVACGDTIYKAPGTGSKIWIDPEFKCEYFLSEYSDGSATRIGPGAPRMAVIDRTYVHVCRA